MSLGERCVETKIVGRDRALIDARLNKAEVRCHVVAGRFTSLSHVE